MKFRFGKEKRIALLLGIILIGLLVNGWEREEGKVYRVGFLGRPSFEIIADGFKAKMRELGYVEGESVVYHSHEYQVDLKAMADQFVADKVDLIFTSGSTPTALTAKAAARGTGVPVVFAYAGVEGTGLVNSVRAPGGNITGVRYPGPETISKRLEILLTLAPETKRVWIGYDKNSYNIAPTLEVLRPAAVALGIKLVEVPATTKGELGVDLATRAASNDLGLDGIILMPDGFNHSPEGLAMVSQFAVENNVPLGGSFAYTVKAGALFGNAENLFNVGELAAPLAAKVLSGIPAGTIPVVSPESFLIINYKQAQNLELTVPEGLLRQATEIIR